MNTRAQLMIVAALLAMSPLEAQGPRAMMIEARNLAYDANYRNDQAGLRSALAILQSLEKSSEAGYANYYLSWTYGALASSEIQANDATHALESARRALACARLAVAARPNDPEFQVILAQALIMVMILDPPQFQKTFEELTGVRRKALELAPANPRLVVVDAGIIFNNPSDANGKERGIARWQEALRLFDEESKTTSMDPIEPRWGYALAYAGLANLYLRMTPPKSEEARRAAETALRMRPDFWYARTQLPQQ